MVLLILGIAVLSYLAAWVDNIAHPQAPMRKVFGEADWVLEFVRCLVCLTCGYVWYFHKFRDECVAILQWRVRDNSSSWRLWAFRLFWLVSVVGCFGGVLFLNREVLPAQLETLHRSKQAQTIGASSYWRAFQLPYWLLLPNSLVLYVVVFPTMLWASLHAGFNAFLNMRDARSSIPRELSARPARTELRSQVAALRGLFLGQVRDGDRFSLYIILGFFVIFGHRLVRSALSDPSPFNTSDTGLLPASTAALYAAMLSLATPATLYLASATWYSYILSRYVWVLESQGATKAARHVYRLYNFRSVMARVADTNSVVLLIAVLVPVLVEVFF